MTSQQTFGFMDSESSPDPPSTDSILSTTLPKHELIRASAGTGKTHQLSSRFLRLLAAGQPVERILATTFTRKAAGEIFDRVIERLAKATVDDATRQQLADDTRLPDLSIEECQSLLARLTQRLHRIRISTIDSFFGTIARSFSLEIGLPPTWQIIDEHVDEALRLEALNRTMVECGIDTMYDLVLVLTEGEAKRSVTRTVLEAINEVYEYFLATENEGDAAWTAVPQPPLLDDDGWARLLTEFEQIPMPSKGMDKAHQESCAALQNSDWKTFFGKGLGKAIPEGKDKFRRVEISDAVRQAYQTIFGVYASQVISRLRNRTLAAYELAAAFHEHYVRLKIDHEAVLFNDIPQRLSQLADSDRQQRLVYRLDSKIDHLLLDEFQDTSGVQWDCFRGFAEDITRRTDEDASFFCVGDVKQAIYGWRGGQTEILDSLPHRLPNVTPRKLDVSYRSSPIIIETVNQVFGNLLAHSNLGEMQSAITDWGDNFPEHETDKKQLSGYACLRVATENEDDASPSDGVMRQAAEWTKEIAQQTPQLTVGVLLRTQKQLVQMVNHLRAAKVFASEEGGNPLTDSAAVEQILSLMQIADHPGDAIAAYHVATGPLADRLQLQVEANQRVAERDVRKLSRRVRRQLQDEGYGACLQRWASWLEVACSDREWARLSQLVDLAYAYQPRSTLRPQDFVAFVRREHVSDPTSANVRVMTIHQAKGLEFDIVVLAPTGKKFIEPQNFAVEYDSATFRPKRILRYPSRRERRLLPQDLKELFDTDTARHVREYLCIWYVALTRAKRALHIIVPTSKTTHTRNTAGLLCATLSGEATRESGQILFEHGDRLWYQQDPPPTTPPVTGRPEIELKLRKRFGETNRGQDSIAPSQRAAAQVIPSGAFFSASREQALELGTLMHAWMESIEWLQPGERPAIARLRQIAVTLGEKLVDESQALDEFYAILDQPTVAATLDPTAYRNGMRQWLAAQGDETADLGDLHISVHNEKRIVIEEDGVVSTGEIDRLLLCYRGETPIAAEIIDHKTDQVTTDTQIQERADHYAPQLAAYRQAVSEAYGLPPQRIRTRLLLLRADRAVDI